MFKPTDYEKIRKKILERSKRTCYYLDCKQKTIFSHIISKSISISEISHENHVVAFSPKRHGDKKMPLFSSFGINDTPAFNGFCHQHDALFNYIDEQPIEDLYGVYLQLYRSITKEIDHLRFGDILYPDYDVPVAVDKVIEHTIKESAHKNMSPDKVLVAQKHLEDTFTSANETKNQILASELETTQKIQNFFFEQLTKKKETLIDLKLEKNLLQTLDIKEIDSQVFILLTDFKIPVAISAEHTLPGSNGYCKNYYIVIPYKEHNAIIGVTNNEANYHLNNRITTVVNSLLGCEKDNFSVLNFIERLVITSPEYCQFHPSVINDMQPQKKDVFINDCMFLHEFLANDKYFHEYEMSIFDNVRSQLLARNENSIERQKMNFIPTRDSYESREIEMFKKINKENLTLNSTHFGE